MSLQHDPLSNLRLFEDAVTRMRSEPRTSRPWSPPGGEPDPSIKGERRFEENSTGKGYHRIERSYGRLMRGFALPNSVDTEKVSADYQGWRAHGFAAEEGSGQGEASQG